MMEFKGELCCRPDWQASRPRPQAPPQPRPAHLVGCSVSVHGHRHSPGLCVLVVQRQARPHRHLRPHDALAAKEVGLPPVHVHAAALALQQGKGWGGVGKAEGKVAAIPAMRAASVVPAHMPTHPPAAPPTPSP